MTEDSEQVAHKTAVQRNREKAYREWKKKKKKEEKQKRRFRKKMTKAPTIFVNGPGNYSTMK